MTSPADPAALCGILLAAGHSRRFGSNKLLHPLDDGTPMALASARRLRAMVPQVLVVLQASQSALQALCRAEGLPCLCVDNDGMGDSLAAAVRASAGAAGWLVALADMPFIQPASYRTVHEALCQGAPLAAPVWQGQRGHPVGFSAALYPELAALQGDEGARQVLQRHRSALRLLDVPDPGVLRDVDTPADLAPGEAARRT